MPVLVSLVIPIYDRASYLPQTIASILFMTFHFRLIHRSCFEQIGGIDPRSGLVPDYDLCLRLSEVCQIHHHPHSLYHYRIHPDSMSHQRQRETIADSQAAVERALHRRGLSDRYQLNVQLTQTDTQLKSRFLIEPKPVPHPMP